MTKFRRLSIVLAIAAAGAVSFGTAANAAESCTHTAAEYRQAVTHFEGQVAQARAAAERNPLLEADLGYYTSVLSDARTCLRTVAPVTTALR